MGLIHAILFVAITALPPLTDAQRGQLESADDASGQWDTPALYPLMANAVGWSGNDPAAPVPGSINPDYAAILASPAEYRGQLFMIEGQVAEAIEQELLRPGAWGESVWRWVVQVDPVKDEVVVVWLTNPPGNVRLADRVRLPARFYKLWPQRTRQGEPTTYMTFVGHSAAVVVGPTPVVLPGAPTTSRGTQLGVILTVIAVAAALLWMLRRMTRLSLTPRPLPSQLRRHEHEHEHEHAAESTAASDNGDDTGPPLPPDPAAALEELEKRHVTG